MTLGVDQLLNDPSARALTRGCGLRLVSPGGQYRAAFRARAWKNVSPDAEKLRWMAHFP